MGKYHSHLSLLLTHVALRALWKIYVHIISTLVNNKSLLVYVVVIVVTICFDYIDVYISAFCHVYMMYFKLCPTA